MDEKELYGEMKKLLESEGLVTARLVESVSRTAQMCSVTLPEMQVLFDQWLSLIGGEVRRVAEPGKEIDVSETAGAIGISPSSLLAILLSLQRRGKISVKSLRIGEGKEENEDICSCLRER